MEKRNAQNFWDVGCQSKCKPLRMLYFRYSSEDVSRKHPSGIFMFNMSYVKWIQDMERIISLIFPITYRDSALITKLIYLSVIGYFLHMLQHINAKLRLWSTMKLIFIVSYKKNWAFRTSFVIVLRTQCVIVG